MRTDDPGAQSATTAPPPSTRPGGNRNHPRHLARTHAHPRLRHTSETPDSPRRLASPRANLNSYIRHKTFDVKDH